ncbi:VWA domain-containing protein [bacterium]|nr:MAG: VWA domain-containing protein [bacterium]RIK60436.1 MAG: hypothetical protein DCC64_14655 [Planctomycetota bacterium]
MDWPRLSSVTFEHPAWLALAFVTGALALGAGALVRRQPGAVRAFAGPMRVAALALVGLALASPVVDEPREERFDPAGVWVLRLAGPWQPVRGQSWFSEEPQVFAARVRNALALGHPPTMVEIHSTEEISARDACALVRALNVPCVAVLAPRALEARDAWLGQWLAPASLAPGEAFDGSLSLAGTSQVRLRFAVNGQEVEVREVQAPEQVAFPRAELPPGRHILTSELVGRDGTVVQRVGHVVRVGAPPRLMALGFDEVAFTRLARLAPSFTRSRVEPRTLTSAMLRECEVVVMPVSAGVSLTSSQSRDLARFVANGGGLFVTGDGAAGTNRAYLDTGFRELLPVRLLEQRQEKPPDPPIEEEIGKAEVAAVSILFVIDRSGSMDTAIGTGSTRWRIAVEAVKQALAKLDPWDRAGVLSFTLSREWRPAPKVIAPFDRELIARDLLSLKGDRNFEAGFNTDIYGAVSEALDVAEKEKSAVKVVVVLTDGADKDDPGGKVRNHRELAIRAMSKGINIVALGIGDGFIGEAPDVRAARRVIQNLATKPEFAKIANDAESARSAPVIFVNAVEFAYKAYDDEMQRRERERQKRPVETPKDPRLDVLEGRFALTLTPVGSQLLGMRDLPEPRPRLLRYARCQLRQEAALALGLASDERGEAQPVALAVSSFGLGRVAFWSSGLDPSSLGDVASWAEWPRLAAQALRYLTPREDPQPRLFGRATTGGIGVLDPIEGARYGLRTERGETPLELKDGRLVAREGTLEEGAAEVIEALGSERRVLGDVWLTLEAPPDSAQRVQVEPDGRSPLQPRSPDVTVRREKALAPVIWALALMLALMPLERLIRRRS